MFHVRTTKTSSSSIAVQVVRYEGKRIILLKHIGSGKNQEEILKLKQIAYDYVRKLYNQPGLFDLQKKKSTDKIIQVSKSKYLGTRYTFI